MSDERSPFILLLREEQERVRALQQELADAKHQLEEAKIRVRQGEEVISGLNERLTTVDPSELSVARFGALCAAFALKHNLEGEALDALRLGSRLCNPLASFRLGKLYLTGKGSVQCDPVMAFGLFRAASVSPDSPIGVFAAMGRCYEEGLGVPVDLNQAVEMYAEGAALSHCEAELALGVCYLDGKGVSADRRRGWEFIERAAEHGSAVARKMLENALK